MKGLSKKGWKKIRLGEVCFNVNETVKNPLAEGIERYIGLEHIEPENLHIKVWGNVADGTTFIKKFAKGQVLFGKRRAYQKKAALADFNGICSGDIIVLEADENLVNKKLFPFLVSSDRLFDFAVQTSVGSLSPRTKFQDLAHFEFLLPNKEQQIELAELLCAADNAIVKLLDVSNVLKLISEINIGKLRKQNFFKANGRLFDILELNYGAPLKDSDRVDGEYFVLGSAGKVGVHNQYNVEGPGIVVGRKGGAGLVTYVEENFWVIDTAFWVKPKNDNYNLKFIYYLLKSLNLPSLAITTAVPGLNRDDAHFQKIHLFSEKEQNDFLKEHLQLESLIKATENRTDMLKRIFRKMVNEIFSFE